MPPRKTTDFGALFESLIEDMRIQVAASVDRTLSDFSKRLARIERRLDQLDPQNATNETTASRRICALCERTAVARGLCSAHYQQWRYRERKSRLARRARDAGVEPMSQEQTDPAIEGPLILTPTLHNSQDN